MFSCGYSFRFNAEDPSGLGYVLPEWVDATPEAVTGLDRSMLSGATTILWLPWHRSGGLAPQKTPEDLRQEVRGEFGPALLLFLRRLEVLELVDMVDHARLCLQR